MKRNLSVRSSKAMSYSMAVVFSAVGLLFLFLPNGVLHFFNSVSMLLGMTAAPENGLSFFLVLAAAYMYVVTLLAWMMGRHPESSSFPLLLANAKISSSLLSFGFFIVHQPYLIFLTNGIVDGLIGVGAWILYQKSKESRG